jgi:hypothetical protein
MVTNCESRKSVSEKQEILPKNYSSTNVGPNLTGLGSHLGQQINVESTRHLNTGNPREVLLPFLTVDWMVIP